MPSREDYQAAAKLISDWGCEGVESAARLIGYDAASGMASEQVRRNVQESFPEVNVRGDETAEEIQYKISLDERRRIKSKLTPAQLKEVRVAEKVLRKYKLYR